MIRKAVLFLMTAYLAGINVSLAAVDPSTVVVMNVTAKKGVGKPTGTITLQASKYGLIITPAMYGLSPGLHGLHIHENPSCDDNGMAAGGHIDPYKTGKHAGPYSDKGHLGDLPAIYVAPDGTASLPVLAPRITTMATIQNRALMLHSGGDNYADKPEKMGGGRSRMVCGIIK